jgi:hypothetical protein
MTEERFIALAEAYGGDIGRWPQRERVEAAAFAQAEPLVAASALAASHRLDQALDADRVGEPSLVLRQRVIAAAPAAHAARALVRWAMGVGLGLGLAGACAAGVIVGLTETPRSVVRFIDGTPPPAAEPTDEVSGLVAPAARQDGA